MQDTFKMIRTHASVMVFFVVVVGFTWFGGIDRCNAVRSACLLLSTATQSIRFNHI